MAIGKGSLLTLMTVIGICGLTGCISYTKENGSQCKVSMFPTSLIGTAFGLKNTYCSGLNAEEAASRAQVAASQASDWADSTLSDLRNARSAKANGWSDQVADHIASARQNARGTRDFANTAKGLAEWATTNAPNSASTKDVVKFAQDADSFATSAEKAAAEAKQLLSP
ncbi:MAG: hypothetical protein ACK5M5_11560 [Limnobaculum xujianqingii]